MRLKILSLLVAGLKNKCYFAVFGGLAVDAYYGRITRFHDDLDLICWREDVPTIRKELKRLGYKTKLYFHPQEKKLIYKLCTTDKNKTYTFQIADRKGKDNFKISFWLYAHLIFPIKYLSVKWKQINSVKFPVVTKELLTKLKQKQVEFYMSKKAVNIEKYLFKQNKNYLKAIHDLKLLLPKS